MSQPELSGAPYLPKLDFIAIDTTGVPQPLVLDTAGNLQVSASFSGTLTAGGLNGYGTLFVGQSTATTTSQTLGSNGSLHFVTLQSSYSNTGITIYWGTGTSLTNELAAGDSTAPIPIGNTNLINYKCSSSTATLNWYGV